MTYNNDFNVSADNKYYGALSVTHFLAQDLSNSELASLAIQYLINNQVRGEGVIDGVEIRRLTLGVLLIIATGPIRRGRVIPP